MCPATTLLPFVGLDPKLAGSAASATGAGHATVAAAGAAAAADSAANTDTGFAQLLATAGSAAGSAGILSTTLTTNAPPISLATPLATSMAEARAGTRDEGDLAEARDPSALAADAILTGAPLAAYVTAAPLQVAVASGDAGVPAVEADTLQALRRALGGRLPAPDPVTLPATAAGASSDGGGDLPPATRTGRSIIEAASDARTPSRSGASANAALNASTPTAFAAALRDAAAVAGPLGRRSAERLGMSDDPAVSSGLEVNAGPTRGIDTDAASGRVGRPPAGFAEGTRIGDARTAIDTLGEGAEGKATRLASTPPGPGETTRRGSATASTNASAIAGLVDGDADTAMGLPATGTNPGNPASAAAPASPATPATAAIPGLAAATPATPATPASPGTGNPGTAERTEGAATARRVAAAGPESGGAARSGGGLAGPGLTSGNAGALAQTAQSAATAAAAAAARTEADLAKGAGGLADLAPTTPSFAATLQNATPDRVDNVVVSAPVGSPAWPNEAAQKLANVVLMRKELAELQLNPANLGPIGIRIDFTTDQPSIVITAADPTTRAALDQTLPQLRDLLANQGITLGQASVQDGSPQQQRSFASAPAPAGRGTAEPLAPQPAIPVGRTGTIDRLVDTFA